MFKQSIQAFFRLGAFIFIYAFLSFVPFINIFPLSISIYAAFMFFSALRDRKKKTFTKGFVDLVYYSTGVVALVVFTWGSADQTNQINFPRSTIAEAFEANQLELRSAKEFSLLFHRNPQSLVDRANRYIDAVKLSPETGDCVLEYEQYNGSRGIHVTDWAGVTIRGSIGLGPNAPIHISQKCVDAFGGRPASTSIFDFWKLSRKAEIQFNIFEVPQISNAAEFEKNIHLFLNMAIDKGSLRIVEFVEYLIDDEGNILTIESFEELEEVSGLELYPPQPFVRFDEFIARFNSTAKRAFEYALWPILALFLLGLKISTVSSPIFGSRQQN